MSGIFFFYITLAVYHTGPNVKTINSGTYTVVVTLGKQDNLWVIKSFPFRVMM